MMHYQLLVSPQTPERTSVVNLAGGENWLQLQLDVDVAPAADYHDSNNDRRGDDPTQGIVRPTIVRPSVSLDVVKEGEPQQPPPLAATDDCFLCFQYHRGLLWVKDMRYYHHHHRETSSSVSLQGHQSVWTASLLTYAESKEGVVEGEEMTPSRSSSEVLLGPRQAMWLKHGDRIRVTVGTTGDDDLVPVVPPWTVWLEFHCSNAAAREDAADALRTAHRAMQWAEEDRSHGGADKAEAPSVVGTDAPSHPSVTVAEVAQPPPLAADNETAVLTPPLLPSSTRDSHSPGDAVPPVPPLSTTPMTPAQMVKPPSEINRSDEGRNNTRSQYHCEEQSLSSQRPSEDGAPPTPRETVVLSPNKPDVTATMDAAKPNPNNTDADTAMDMEMDVGDTVSDDDGGGSRPDDDDCMDKDVDDPSIARAPNSGTQPSQSSLGYGVTSDNHKLREPFSAPSTSEWLTQPTSQEGGTDGRTAIAEHGHLDGRTAQRLLATSQPDEAALTQETFVDRFGPPNGNSTAAPPTGISEFESEPLTDPVGTSSSHSSGYHLLDATDSQSHQASISGTQACPDPSEVSDAASLSGGDTNAPEVAAAPPTPRIDHQDAQDLSPAESHASSQPLLTPPGMIPSSNRRQEPPSLGEPRVSPQKLLFQGIEPRSTGTASEKQPNDQQQHGVPGGDHGNAINASASELSDRTTHLQQLKSGVATVDLGPVVPCPATDSQCLSSRDTVEEQSAIPTHKVDREKQSMDVGRCEPSMLGESGTRPEEGARAPTASPSGTSLEPVMIDPEAHHRHSPESTLHLQTPASLSAERNDNEPGPRVESVVGEAEHDGESKPSPVPPKPRGRPPKERVTASRLSAPPSHPKTAKVPTHAGEGSVRRSSRKRLIDAVVALSDQPEHVPARKKRRDAACRNLSTDLEEENSSSGNSPTCYVLVTRLKEAASKKVAKVRHSLFRVSGSLPVSALTLHLLW